MSDRRSNTSQKIWALNQRPTVTHAITMATVPIVSIVLAMLLSYFYHWLMILAMAFIATRFREINNLIHWASHGSLCRNRKVNDSIGNVLCMFLGFDFDEYRSEHTTHHIHLGSYKNDQDFKKLEELMIGQSIGMKNRLSLIFSIKMLTLYYPKFGIHSLKQTISTVFYLLIGIILIMNGAAALALLLTASLFSIYPLVRHITDIVDHGGIYESKNLDFRSRNFIIENKFLRWVFFPIHDCFHRIHHDYPFVSPISQEVVHNELMKESEYRSKSHYWYEHFDDFLMNRPLGNLFNKEKYENRH